MSRHEPQFENDAFRSELSVAPTVMASGARAGDVVHASALLFPAAATTTIPSATADATAASSGS